MAAVARDGVNGAVMTLELPEGPESVRVPQLEHPASAAAQQGRRAGDHAQRTHPVTVGVRDLLMGRKIEGFKSYEEDLSDLIYKLKL